ncbi:DoxX family protein [Microvirga roseola]|uniref:DoxX family protein n=1 Tax=Microvirga roseola TaxID=2883126 RepID=UPI001E3CC06C|nr:DoxX family protein [Microvirga roseola]
MSSAILSPKITNLPSNKMLSAVAPAFGRVLIAAIFLLSGISKLTAPDMTIGYIQAVGLPLPVIAYGAAVFVEIVGGVALIVGFQTRLVALTLAGFTLITAVAFHANLGDQNQFFHFFKNIAMAGGLLQVLAFGAGPFSIDGQRR